MLAVIIKKSILNFDKNGIDIIEFDVIMKNCEILKFW
jgi:hypothetical protein